jgi:hypothetical protein
MSDPKHNDFESAGDQAGNLLSQIWQMLRQNKKYWLLPIIIVLLLLGVIIILGATSAAPFIYTLF